MALIRLATLGDAPAIAHVHVESWRTTYRGIVPSDYLRALNETDRAQRWIEQFTRDVLILVAEADSKIVGFACGGPIRERVEQCDAELYAIYLLEQAQRSGIGTELLRELARLLLARSFRSMAVWVLDENPSRHFYASRGAHHVSSKDIEIGGARLKEVSYAWLDLEGILSVAPNPSQVDAASAVAKQPTPTPGDSKS